MFLETTVSSGSQDPFRMATLYAILIHIKRSIKKKKKKMSLLYNWFKQTH